MLPQVGLVAARRRQEGQSRLGQDGEGEHERALHQQRRKQVGQQVHDDDPPAGAERFRRLDELQLAQHQNCAARTAHARRIDGAERDHHVGQRGAQAAISAIASRMSGNAISASVTASATVELAHVARNHAQCGAEVSETTPQEADGQR